MVRVGLELSAESTHGHPEVGRVGAVGFRPHAVEQLSVGTIRSTAEASTWSRRPPVGVS